MEGINPEAQLYGMTHRDQCFLVYENIVFNDPIDRYKYVVINGQFEPSLWTLGEIQQLYQLRPDSHFWRNFVDYNSDIMTFLVNQRVINLELLKRWMNW